MQCAHLLTFRPKGFGLERKAPLLIFALLLFGAQAAGAQSTEEADALGHTLYDEGRGTFVEALPGRASFGAVSPTYGRTRYLATGSVTHRLTGRLDAGLSASYRDQTSHTELSAQAGYTLRLDRIGWSLRPSIGAGLTLQGPELEAPTFGANVFFYRPVALNSFLSVYPGLNAGIGTEYQFGEWSRFFERSGLGGPNLVGGATLAVPISLHVGQGVRLTATPAHTIGTTSRHTGFSESGIWFGGGITF